MMSNKHQNHSEDALGLSSGSSSVPACVVHEDHALDSAAPEETPRWLLQEHQVRFGKHPYDVHTFYYLRDSQTNELVMKTKSPMLAQRVRELLEEGVSLLLDQGSVGMGFTVGGDVGIVFMGHDGPATRWRRVTFDDITRWTDEVILHPHGEREFWGKVLGQYRLAKSRDERYAKDLRDSLEPVKSEEPLVVVQMGGRSVDEVSVRWPISRLLLTRKQFDAMDFWQEIAPEW